PDAVAELEEIAHSARGSVTEMRRLLGVLRTEDHPTVLAPRQGGTATTEVALGFRRAVGCVDWRMRVLPVELSATVDLTAYRVVQEALSNAVRHAPGAGIELQVAFGPEAVTLRVHNEVPPTAPPPAPAGPGTGLRGMQERVSRLAGTLEHG